MATHDGLGENVPISLLLSKVTKNLKYINFLLLLFSYTGDQKETVFNSSYNHRVPASLLRFIIIHDKTIQSSWWLLNGNNLLVCVPNYLHSIEFLIKDQRHFSIHNLIKYGNFK